MIGGKLVYVVIPARGGSKRLLRKNIYPVCGKSMIGWSIDACKKSKYIDSVYVSSEDQEILDVSKEFNAKIINRPNCLSEDHVYKQEAIVDATNQILNSSDINPHIVISLQANSPQVNSFDLDSAIEKFIKFDRNELISVNEALIQNAAFRIMKLDYVFQKTLSTKCGVYVTNYMDIHTIDDVQLVENILLGD